MFTHRSVFYPIFARVEQKWLKKQPKINRKYQKCNSHDGLVSTLNSKEGDILVLYFVNKYQTNCEYFYHSISKGSSRRSTLMWWTADWNYPDVFACTQAVCHCIMPAGWVWLSLHKVAHSRTPPWTTLISPKI